MLENLTIIFDRLNTVGNHLISSYIFLKKVTSSQEPLSLNTQGFINYCVKERPSDLSIPVF